MAEGQTRHKVTRSLSKRVFAPLAQAAVAAGTAFLTRKAMQLWQEKLQPKVEEKGGPRAVAEETLKSVTGKAEDESSASTEADRRQRKQRRDQRRRALEKSS